MKKKIFYAIIAALSLTSCVGDLDQTPMAGDVVNGVYGDPILRKGALAKIYGGFSLVGQYGPGSTDIDVKDAGASEFLRAWWSLQTISTDECKCVWGDSWVTEINQNTWSTTKNDAIYATYTRAIMMISYANDFLRNTTDADPEVAVERSEVRFLRAFAYWVLLDTFGNPPFVLETDPIGAFKPKQIKAVDLYAWLERELVDLTSETSHLKPIKTQVYPRVDQGAAYGLLARLYLNHKTYLGEANPQVYEKAAEAAQKVIDHYPLAQNYNALFMGDNSTNPDALQEFVYAACYDANNTQSFGGTTYLICAGQGEQQQLGVGGNWNGLVVSSEFAAQLIGQPAVNSSVPGEKPNYTSTLDNRAMISIQYSASKDMTGSDFSKGWHVEKFNNNRFLDPDVDYAKKEKFSSVDFPLIRAGEMYLVYAEAKIRATGGEQTSDAKAIQYVKDLQIRANRDPRLIRPEQGQALTLDDVFTEISRELYWEGLRRTTLIRFDKYHSAHYLWPWKAGVKNGQEFAAYMDIFPIPEGDRKINENLSQNEGYLN